MHHMRSMPAGMAKCFRAAYPIVALIREEDIALLIQRQAHGESEGGLRGRSAAARTAVPQEDL